MGRANTNSLTVLLLVLFFESCLLFGGSCNPSPTHAEVVTAARGRDGQCCNGTNDITDGALARSARAQGNAVGVNSSCTRPTMSCFTAPLYIASAMLRDAILTVQPKARALAYDTHNDVTGRRSEWQSFCAQETNGFLLRLDIYSFR